MIPPHIIAILCNGVALAALLMLWGATLTRLRLLPDAGAQLWEPPLRIALALAVLLALPVEAARIAGGWPVIRDPAMMRVVLLETTPGRAWLVEAVSATFFLACLQIGAQRLALPCGLALMAGFSMSGHAAASEGIAGLIRQANHVLHLAASAAWLGALPFLPSLLRRLDHPGAVAILKRYSGEGHFWVALVLLTGTVATIWTVGGLPLNLSVPYQALLMLKILAVLVMVGLAIHNRYVVVPRLAARPDGAAQIARAISAEIVLGLLAVALVAWLATLRPH